VTRPARPCTTTGWAGSLVDTVQRGSAARLRAFRDSLELLNQRWPARQIPQTGIKCGTPAGVTVASQKSCEAASRSSAHDHRSRPLPAVAGRVP